MINFIIILLLFIFIILSTAHFKYIFTDYFALIMQLLTHKATEVSGLNHLR